MKKILIFACVLFVSNIQAQVVMEYVELDTLTEALAYSTYYNNVRAGVSYVENKDEDKAKARASKILALHRDRKTPVLFEPTLTIRKKEKSNNGKGN